MHSGKIHIHCSLTIPMTESWQFRAGPLEDCLKENKAKALCFLCIGLTHLLIYISSCLCWACRSLLGSSACSIVHNYLYSDIPKRDHHLKVQSVLECLFMLINSHSVLLERCTCTYRPQHELLRDMVRSGQTVILYCRNLMHGTILSIHHMLRVTLQINLQ